MPPVVMFHAAMHEQLFGWLVSDDQLEDAELCLDHAILTEMLFTEGGVMKPGDKLTVADTVDADGQPFLVMEDESGQMWYFGIVEQLTWVEN